jgi:hypothetical protein
LLAQWISLGRSDFEYGLSIRLPPLYIPYEPPIPVHSSPTHFRISISTFRRKRFNFLYSFSKWTSLSHFSLVSLWHIHS